jgi:IclR family acetate operon transcriptional repressor
MPKANENSQTPEPNYPIGSVDSALRLLLLLREYPRLRVSDVSEHLGVARSTAHRLLAMLVTHGFVTRDPQTRLYSAGDALLLLGLSAVHNYDIRTNARPHLERLAAEVHETVHLLVMNGTDSFFVDGVETDQVVRVGSRIGVSFPAHTTSGGKALLAELSTTQLRKLYPRQRLKTVSPSGLKSRTALEAELEEIRTKGYALNLGETEEDIGAVAAVIRRAATGEPVGALAIAAPLSRTDRDTLVAMSRPLLEACRLAGDGRLERF